MKYISGNGVLREGNCTDTHFIVRKIVIQYKIGLVRRDNVSKADSNSEVVCDPITLDSIHQAWLTIWARTFRQPNAIPVVSDLTAGNHSVGNWDHFYCGDR